MKQIKMTIVLGALAFMTTSPVFAALCTKIGKSCSDNGCSAQGHQWNCYSTTLGQCNCADIDLSSNSVTTLSEEDSIQPLVIFNAVSGKNIMYSTAPGGGGHIATEVENSNGQ